MKKEMRKSGREEGDLLPEYRFDYSKSKPNRFASRAKGMVRAVVLDPDVAEVFESAESVNAFLRSAIRAMPPRKAAKAAPLTKTAPRKKRAS